MGLLDNIDDSALTNGLLGFATMASKKRPFTGLLAGLSAYEQTQAKAAAIAEQKAMEERKMKLEEEFKRAQMAELYSQVLARKAAEERAAETGGMVNNLLNRPGAPSQYGVSGSGINLGGVQEPMRPQAGGLAGASLDEVAKLKTRGVDLLDAYKFAQQGTKFDGGSVYRFADGTERFVPKTDTGQVLGRDGRINYAPGFVESVAGLEGAKTAAQKREEARYTLGPVNPGTGMVTRSVLDALEGFKRPKQSPQSPSGVFDPLEMARAEAVSTGKPVQYNLRGQQGIFSGEGEGGIKTALAPGERWTNEPDKNRRISDAGVVEPLRDTAGNDVSLKPKKELDAELRRIKGFYDDLKANGGIPSTENGVVKNTLSMFGATDLGRAAGRAVGSKNTAALDTVTMARPLLLATLIKATGMSAQQINSNQEMKLWLDAASDPARGYEANMEALNNIGSKYGNGPIVDLKKKRSLDDLLKQYGD